MFTNPFTIAVDAMPIATPPQTPTNERLHSHSSASTSSSTDSDSDYPSSSDESPTVTSWQGPSRPSRSSSSSSRQHTSSSSNPHRNRVGRSRGVAHTRHRHKQYTGLSQEPRVLEEIADAIATRLQQIPDIPEQGGGVGGCCVRITRVVEHHVTRSVGAGDGGVGTKGDESGPLSGVRTQQLVDPTPHDLGFLLEKISRKV